MQSPQLNEIPNSPPIPDAFGNVRTPATGGDVTGGDVTGGLIPYKNSNALISYYIGLFSALPVIGLPMGIAAIVLGVKGLRAVKENPIIKGKAHAWVGIICGAFWTIFYSLLILLVLVSMFETKR